ncbi:hypothetical protein evm_002405 [Chilo suppressalis]|nr:hypothetical protein evm_002405 [Chilo suppressalis]
MMVLVPQVYARAVPHPFASSLAQEMFQSGIIPADTDFRIFRDFGQLSGVRIKPVVRPFDDLPAKLNGIRTLDITFLHYFFTFRKRASAECGKQVYARAVPHPFASSLAQEMFQSGIIPADTDFRIFRDFGQLSGVDLAWSSDGYVYHTRLDDAARVPLPVLQRTGDNVLALATGHYAIRYHHTPIQGRIQLWRQGGAYSRGRVTVGTDCEVGTDGPSPGEGHDPHDPPGSALAPINITHFTTSQSDGRQHKVDNGLSLSRFISSEKDRLISSLQITNMNSQ